MENTPTLRHFTDCAGPQGPDTETRIKQVYRQHGYSAEITGGLQNPLQVAFTVATTLSENLKPDVPYEKSRISNTPVALNAAPRAKTETQSKAAEDYLYYLNFEDDNIPEMVVYGPEVVEWLMKFFQGKVHSVQQILDIEGKGIKNTSKGTQFRSKAFLPIAHIAALEDKLLSYSSKQSNLTESYQENHIKDGEIIPIPADEFGNGRFILNANTWSYLQSKGEFCFPEKNNDNPIPIVESLTDVGLDEWGIWEFSNKLPGNNIVIGCAIRKNVGRRDATINIDINK